MFRTDSREEQFLDVIGAKWHYTNEATFEELVKDWDTRNLGRPEAVDPEAVKEYGSLMDKGSAAPAPILWLNAEKLKEILDGVQRLLAEYKRNPAKFSAYIVTSDSPSLARKIRVFANLRLQGGHQESSEWTLERAIEVLVIGGDMNLEEVAEMGGWSISTVRDKKKVIDYRQAVLGVGVTQRPSDALMRMTAKHAKLTDFAAAPREIGQFFHDLVRMRASAADAEPYVQEFFDVNRSKKLFEQFSRKLKEFHSDEEVQLALSDPGRRCYRSMTPDGRLMKAVKGAITAAKGIRDNGETITCTAECLHELTVLRKIVEKLGGKRQGRKKRK